MKKLAFILLIFVGCIEYSGTPITVEQWSDYKKDCYNDSTMVVIEINQGIVSDSTILFARDTVWTHKNPTWDDFINKLK